MSEEIKIFRGQENQKQEDSKDPDFLGNVLPPTGLPDYIRTLVITLDTRNSNIQIAGCVEDKITCYGMLESAKDIIQTHNDSRIKMSSQK